MADETDNRSITFHYIKSNSFRVVHGDGVWGGGTPNGNISMSFWSQRAPIPQTLTHEITPGGDLGDEIARESKQDVIREVEVAVVVSLDVAKSLVTWLEDKVERLDRAHPANQ